MQCNLKSPIIVVVVAVAVAASVSDQNLSQFFGVGSSLGMGFTLISFRCSMQLEGRKLRRSEANLVMLQVHLIKITNRVAVALKVWGTIRSETSYCNICWELDGKGS